MLIGSTAAPNIRVATLTAGNNITPSNGSGTITLNVTGTTNHAIQVGNASASLTSLATGSSGQVLQSAGAGADPAFSTATYPATAGSSGNVLTSDGTNWTSSPPAAGGMTWSVITADQNITVGNGYICNKAGLLTLTLPASPTAGNLFSVTGINTALGWKVAQNANQQIFIGTSSTTIGTGGSLASINIRDSADFVCVVGGASAVWNVISSIGNLTVV